MDLLNYSNCYLLFNLLKRNYLCFLFQRFVDSILSKFRVKNMQFLFELCHSDIGWPGEGGRRGPCRAKYWKYSDGQLYRLRVLFLENANKVLREEMDRKDVESGKLRYYYSLLAMPTHKEWGL